MGARGARPGPPGNWHKANVKLVVFKGGGMVEQREGVLHKVDEVGATLALSGGNSSFYPWASIQRIDLLAENQESSGASSSGASNEV